MASARGQFSCPKTSRANMLTNKIKAIAKTLGNQKKNFFIISCYHFLGFSWNTFLIFLFGPSITSSWKAYLATML